MSPFLDNDPLGFGSAGFFSIGYRLNYLLGGIGEKAKN